MMGHGAPSRFKRSTKSGCYWCSHHAEPGCTERKPGWPTAGRRCGEYKRAASLCETCRQADNSCPIWPNKTRHCVEYDSTYVVIDDTQRKIAERWAKANNLD